jgi:hypothetical protein
MSACSILPKWQLYFLAIDIVPLNCAYFVTRISHYAAFLASASTRLHLEQNGNGRIQTLPPEETKVTSSCNSLVPQLSQLVSRGSADKALKSFSTDRDGTIMD